MDVYGYNCDNNDDYEDENEKKNKPDFEPKLDGPTWPKFKSDMDKIIYKESPEQDIRFTFIPFLGGHPKRELVINNDDIMNLIIALETSKTIEKFCLLV